MRPLLLVFLLLLSILAQEAHGIRFMKGCIPARRPMNVHVEEAIVCEGRHCSGTKKRKVLSRLMKGLHHWLPSIHEDYYGPRSHKPKHH